MCLHGVSRSSSLIAAYIKKYVWCNHLDNPNGTTIQLARWLYQVPRQLQGEQLLWTAQGKWPGESCMLLTYLSQSCFRDRLQACCLHQDSIPRARLCLRIVAKTVHVRQALNGPRLVASGALSPEDVETSMLVSPGSDQPLY